MATGQRKRTPKTSKGTARGAKKTRMEPLTRVLLGGGILRNIEKPNSGKTKARPSIRFDILDV